MRAGRQGGPGRSPEGPKTHPEVRKRIRKVRRRIRMTKGRLTLASGCTFAGWRHAAVAQGAPLGLRRSHTVIHAKLPHDAMRQMHPDARVKRVGPLRPIGVRLAANPLLHATAAHSSVSVSQSAAIVNLTAGNGDLRLYLNWGLSWDVGRGARGPPWGPPGDPLGPPVSAFLALRGLIATYKLMLLTPTIPTCYRVPRSFKKDLKPGTWTLLTVEAVPQYGDP